ncbi:hypothetical protein CPB85DRAFT_1379468 [Mucidula mucida]|nr:hypothetical protein CPB85DRAFT_1379468 [Mucidula mucida]
MKLFTVLLVPLLSQAVYAHSLVRHSYASQQLPVQDVTSNDITGNANPGVATETVSVAAGSTVGFLLDNTLYHQGPAAYTSGRLLQQLRHGTGAYCEWGATFDPFAFIDYQLSALNTTIPASVPNGEYLLRIEQIGLHISITGGGSANPPRYPFQAMSPQM